MIFEKVVIVLKITILEFYGRKTWIWTGIY